MKITLKFGHKTLETELDEKNFGGYLLPKSFEVNKTESELVEAALENPIESPKLRDILKPGKTLAIVTSDITRPCPSKLLLPPVLREVERAGLADEDVTIVLALGIHRGHTEEELAKLVGADVLKRYKVLDHDGQKCRFLGHTSRGTPLDIFEPVASADHRVLLGNVEYHYFAGYSGGVKALLPGVSSHRAIQNNHSMMVLPDAQAGIIKNNPVREDIEEITKFLSVDFILNVVLGEDKKVRAAFAGDWLKAHRAACLALDDMYRVTLKAPGADAVLVSAGGYPKDINIYQAQKALDNAAKAVRPGGAIIWVGACDEGYGESVFERWLVESRSPADLIGRVKTSFELGGHKAAAIALVVERLKVFMVSNLPDHLCSRLYVSPYPDLDSAIKATLEYLGSQAKIMVMPYGGSTLPGIN
jgi:nickel-dependent lactate racemase